MDATAIPQCLGAYLGDRIPALVQPISIHHLFHWRRIVFHHAWPAGDQRGLDLAVKVVTRDILRAFRTDPFQAYAISRVDVLHDVTCALVDLQVVLYIFPADKHEVRVSD